VHSSSAGQRRAGAPPLPPVWEHDACFIKKKCTKPYDRHAVGLGNLLGLGLGALVDERLVNVRDHAATGDGRFDQRVELLVTADGQLQVPWGDALHAQVARCVACQLEDLGAEVLADGGHVHRRGSTDASMASYSNLQVAMNTSHRKLKMVQR
jgi:hypothetical protein